MRTRRRLPALLPFLLGLSLACAAVGPVGAAAAAAAGVPVIAIDGKGWGHGVGMAQDGALAMGQSGSDAAAILQQFYPGTTLATGGGGTVRVSVLSGAGRSTVLGFPEGGEVRASESGAQPAGFPVAVGPGGSVEVSWDGATYHANAVATAGGTAAAGTEELPLQLISATKPTTPPNKTRQDWLSTSTTAGPAVVTPGGGTAPAGQGASGGGTTGGPAAPPGSPAPAGTPGAAPGTPAPAPAAPAPGSAAAGTLWAVPASGGTTLVTARDRRYRGEIEVTAQAPNGDLELIDRVDVEDYLRGMGEVRDPSWPAASLQTQAIAARTYALRTMAAAGEICDYDRCQVYIGETVEYSQMDAAVAATRGEVLQYNGALATAVYSANAGGTTATPQEGWGGGAGGEPYLRAAPYPTGDPMPWTVDVAPADIGARFGYPGTVAGARVSNAGPSGRALEVTLEGSAGEQKVDGLSFANKLSLRSNLFVFRAAQADVAPAPPPEGLSSIQALPSTSDIFQPLVEAPLPRRTARVAAVIPKPDALGGVGLVGLAVLLIGVSVSAQRRAHSDARRELMRWRP